MLEQLDPVDRDDGDPDPVAFEEPGVARDVDLLEVERVLAAGALELPLRDLAEVAACLRVEDDAAEGHGPAILRGLESRPMRGTTPATLFAAILAVVPCARAGSIEVVVREREGAVVPNQSVDLFRVEPERDLEAP